MHKILHQLQRWISCEYHVKILWISTIWSFSKLTVGCLWSLLGTGGGLSSHTTSCRPGHATGHAAGDATCAATSSVSAWFAARCSFKVVFQFFENFQRSILQHHCGRSSLRHAESHRISGNLSTVLRWDPRLYLHDLWCKWGHVTMWHCACLFRFKVPFFSSCQADAAAATHAGTQIWRLEIRGKKGTIRACKDAWFAAWFLASWQLTTGVDLPSLRGTWTSDADADTTDHANETGDAQVGASKSSNSKM